MSEPRRARFPGEAAVECFRLVSLVAIGVWLMRPFLTPGLCGAGDAQWYANMTADAMQQERAGVFPLFVGQSEYQFNGAIYPLRVAPAFHYLGACLDLLTFHRMHPVALQNLLLVALGAAAIVICYLCLSALEPNRRWLAFMMAVLFLACPGVLGIPYISDLYMTWTTAPIVPIVIYGCIRSFRRMDWPAAICLGGGLGLLWWGHTPIALWMTSLAACAQMIRMATRPPGWAGLGREAAALALFAAVAAYPLVSVLVVTPEPGRGIASFSSSNPGAVVYFVKSAFPAALLPLSPHGADLGDFQLGYSLWALGLASVVLAFRLRSAVVWVLVGWTALLLLLLNPVPGLNGFLWRAVPAAIVNIQGYWAMNRLYLILGCSTAFLGFLTLGESLRIHPAGRFPIHAAAALLCLWSAREAGKFAAGGFAARRPSESGEQFMLLENVGPTRFAYLNFPATPPYFTHGVTDARLQSRLLRRDSGELLAGDLESLEDGTAGGVSLVSRGELKADFFDLGSHRYRYRPTFRLNPGHRYGVIFDFKYPEVAGVLFARGRHLSRLYGLPEFGGSKSFGSSPGHSHLFPLWTDAAESEDIQFEFIAQGEWTGRDLGTLASYRFVDYDPERLPVWVTSFVPYRARVTAPEASWLETPRMYQYTYQALVDGRRVEVAKSPSGLVMVPVPKGTSWVKVQYYPAPSLLVSFWISIAAAVAALAFALAAISREALGAAESKLA